MLLKQLAIKRLRLGTACPLCYAAMLQRRTFANKDSLLTYFAVGAYIRPTKQLDQLLIHSAVGACILVMQRYIVQTI